MMVSVQFVDDILVYYRMDILMMVSVQFVDDILVYYRMESVVLPSFDLGSYDFHLNTQPGVICGLITLVHSLRF